MCTALTSVLTEKGSFRSLACAPTAAHELLPAAGLGVVDGLQVSVQRRADVGVQGDAPQLLHPSQQTHHLGAPQHTLRAQLWTHKTQTRMYPKLNRQKSGFSTS